MRIKGFSPVFILIIIAFAFVLVGGAYYFKNQNNNIKLEPIPSSFTKTQPTLQPSQSPSSKSLPPVKIGFKQYVNNDLGYGFSYSNSISLHECPDSPCLSISQITLSVEALGSDKLSVENVKESLINDDLYCSADGPTGSIGCQNDKVENFTNSLGFKGFKVFRTKTITGSGAATYQDLVYVYLLPRIVKGPGLLDYAAIIFAVDIPLQSNLSELDSIADTFFTL